MTHPSNSIRSSTQRTTLDRIDFALLGALQNNARSSNKELAANVGLAPSSCLTRVRRLERDVIKGYHAELDPIAVGLELQAMISVRLRLHAGEVFETFAAHLRTRPEVVGYWSIGGEIDFLVHVAVTDVRALQELTREAFTSRDEVFRISTALVFEHHHRGLSVAGGALGPAGDEGG
jgi:DNA-binding Lrp family transcriptional regulator